MLIQFKEGQQSASIMNGLVKDSVENNAWQLSSKILGAKNRNFVVGVAIKLKEYYMYCSFKYRFTSRMLPKIGATNYPGY